jgi:hypothetical protein
MGRTKRIVTIVFAGLLLFTIGCATTPYKSPALEEKPYYDRVVAVGDIHGSFSGLVSILREASLIDEANRWIGCNTLLVQTGDLLDMGADVRPVMDLLMSLQSQAEASGGKIVVLLGNHEVMNLVGSLMDVNPDAYQHFVGPGSAEKQRRAFEQWQAVLGTPVGLESGDSEPRKQEWMAKHPPGFAEYTEALGPDGRYGKWLRSMPAMFKYGGTIFVHAGISPDFVDLTPFAINDDVASQIAKFDRIKSYLVQRGYVEPFFSVSEMRSVVNAILEAAETRDLPSAALDTIDRLNESKPYLDGFYDSSSLMINEGPLWFRGFTQWPDEQIVSYLPEWLGRNHAWRVVVSHNPRPDGRIQARLDESVFLIDTGMLSEFYKGGRPSALEIKDDDVTALYEAGERIVFPPAKIVYGPAHVWTGPDGTPLPFKTTNEIEGFLLTASPTPVETIRVGVNRPEKYLLRKDGLQVRAIFRWESVIDVIKAPRRSSRKTQYLRDSYLSEIAAYEVNQILGLNNLPPTVLRTIDGKEGTLQLWAEQTMPDRQRAKDNILPPEVRSWNKQKSDMDVFDNLINNTDRNQTNILIDENWQMILIDHTRSFARDESLYEPEEVTDCSRGLWHALRHLDEAQVRERLSPYLEKAEIDALFVRRQRLVELIQDLIIRNGEEEVLF